MNREQFELMLKLFGCDENTVLFALNAYDIGEEYGKFKCAQELRPNIFSREGVRGTSAVDSTPSEAGGVEELRTGKMQGT